VSLPLSILAELAADFPAPEAVLSQPAKINTRQWALVAQRTGDPEIAWALRALPNPLTRTSIFQISHADPGIRRRRVAVAALMWGYGDSGARWGDDWASSVSGLLSPALDPVLAACEAKLATGDIAEGFGLFTRPGPRGTESEAYRGIGVPFFTKILYFIGRNVLQDSSQEYPLILDTKVSMALAQLTGYRLLVRPADYRPRPDATAYAQFVATIHAWAAKLGVLPEVIEYYLWTEAATPNSALWAACQAQARA
jgi:hypothetical protein